MGLLGNHTPTVTSTKYLLTTGESPLHSSKLCMIYMRRTTYRTTLTPQSSCLGDWILMVPKTEMEARSILPMQDFFLASLLEVSTRSQKKNNRNHKGEILLCFGLIWRFALALLASLDYFRFRFSWWMLVFTLVSSSCVLIAPKMCEFMRLAPRSNFYIFLSCAHFAARF